MSKRIWGICALLALVVVSNSYAQDPTEIWYETTDLGAGRWTVVTADGQHAAHFEHTLAVTENGAVVLTEPE